MSGADDAPDPARPVVRAAGGVVWRPAPSGCEPGNGAEPPSGSEAVEVLVVHRPHRRDWSFPKGKADPGEDDETCARREVAEETGLRCRLGPDLGRVSYVDAKGRPKSVHWWAMTVEADGEGPLSADEVDELRWLTPRRAAELLSYDNDRLVLHRFLRTRAPQEAGGGAG